MSGARWGNRGTMGGALSLALLWILFSSTGAGSQDAGPLEPVPEIGVGFIFLPTLKVSTIYDDNIFFVPGQSVFSPDQATLFRDKPVAASYTRFSENIRTLYRRGPRFTIETTYSVDSELFLDGGDELTEPLARQSLLARARGRPSPNTNLVGTLSYTDTRRSSELIAPTGIELGRVRGRGYDGAYDLEWVRSSRQTLRTRYVFKTTDIRSKLGVVSSALHELGGRWKFDMSPQNALTLGYRYRRFSDGSFVRLFGRDGLNLSHIVTLAFQRGLTKQASVAFDLAPRLATVERLSRDRTLISQRSVDLEGSANFTYSGLRGQFLIDYRRQQNTVLGTIGLIDTDSLSVSYVYQRRRRFRLTLSPRVFRNARDDQHFYTYRGDLSLLVGLTRSVALRGTYQLVRQEGAFAFGGAGLILDSRRVSRNMLLLELTLAGNF